MFLAKKRGGRGRGFLVATPLHATHATVEERIVGIHLEIRTEKRFQAEYTKKKFGNFSKRGAF